MSFFQSLFRRFSKKQEIETLENQENHSELLGGDINSKDDAILDDITLDNANSKDANPDDANLNDDAILNDTNPQADAELKVNIKSEADVEAEVNMEADTEPEVNIKSEADAGTEVNVEADADTELEVDVKSEADPEPEINVKQEDDSDLESVTFLWENRVSKDAELSQESNPKGEPNPQVDTTKDDSVPNGYTGLYTTNISSRDDTRLSRKPEAERQFFDSLFCDSVSSSGDETDYQDIPFRADESISSPLPSTANATPQPPLTFLPLTPATSSTSFSSHKKDEASPSATSEPPTVVENRNSSKTQPMTYLTSEKVFDRAQIADQPRIPWTWSVSGSKNRALYEPTAVGKWWWAWAQDNRDDKRIITNIARIMETELGEQRFGKEKCTRCQKEGLECWIYVDKAEYQVVYAGSACARCRAVPRAMGCSLAIRKDKRRTSPPPPPPQRLLLPKGGHPPVYTGPDTGLGAPAVQAGRPKRTRK